MTTNEQKLVKIYEDAQKQLFNLLTRKVKRGYPASFQKAMLRQVNERLAELNEKSVKWAQTTLSDEYGYWIAQAENNLENWFKYAERAHIPLYGIGYGSMMTINEKAILALTEDTVAKLQLANASWRKAIKRELTRKIATGLTVQEVQARIVENIFNGSKNKIKINGRNYDPVKYAEMVARTSTREATNAASVNEALAVGSDLVKMSSHSPTCSICGPLQGRVYSISGNSSVYPSLDNCFKHGYKTVHPHCRHVFNPYIEELQDDEVLEKDRKRSQEPIDRDSRTKAEIDLYYKQQRENATMWRDLQQYERYKARLGKKNIPNTFEKFRGLKDSDNWAELHKTYREVGWQLKCQKDITVLAKSKLPTKHRPNSVIDKQGSNGKIISRRYFNNNGNVKLDFDLTDHSSANKHPFVPHSHDWLESSTDKPDHQGGRKSTKGELIANNDLIKGGLIGY